MGELHLSDIPLIAAGVLIFLALLIHEVWLPAVRSFAGSCLALLRAVAWDDIMSRARQAVPTRAANQTEQRSDAAEPGREPSGTEAGNLVPDILERLEALDDDQLLDILALLRDDQGEYRFAESRVAKFIPGRVEDRLTQVREIRGTEKPLPPGRVLRVRDNSGERVIPFVEGQRAKG